MFGGGNGKARPWAFSTNRMNQAMCRGPKKSRRQARFAQARIGCSIDHSMGKTGELLPRPRISQCLAKLTFDLQVSYTSSR